MNRDPQLDAGLELPHMQHSIANVLAAHAYYVRTPLAGIQQKGERQSCARPNRVPFLELCDLVLGPAMKAIRFDAYRFHVTSWIIGAQTYFDGMLHHRAQYLP